MALEKITIKTEQNVEVDFDLAPISQRFLAAFIDMVILLIYFSLSTALIAYIFVDEFISGGDKINFWYIFFLVIVYIPFFIYTPMMEFLTKGQTIGKILLKTRVMKVNGENGDASTYFTRWLFRPLEIYILFFGPVGFVLILASGFLDFLIASISSRNQRIGDFFAGGVVVKTQPQRDYTLQDLLAIQSNDNYKPVYKNVVQFSEEDMIFLKKVITKIERHKNDSSKKVAVDLVNKLTELLDLDQVPKKKMTFLKTVLKDYIVLTR